MTFFGTLSIVWNTEYEIILKIQIYHQIDSLLPMLDEDPKLLQIYFMGVEEEKVNTRCNYNHIEK